MVIGTEHHLYWILEIIVKIIITPTVIVKGTGAYEDVLLVVVLVVLVED